MTDNYIVPPKTRNLMFTYEGDAFMPHLWHNPSQINCDQPILASSLKTFLIYNYKRVGL